MNKRVITLGEIMMRLSTPGHERFINADQYNVVYGGAEANVGISLANWGVSTAHVTAFPSHDIGKAAMQYLRFAGIDTQYVFFDEGRMGLYFLENGAMQRSSKIVYDRFDSVFANFDPAKINWEEIFDGADWFHWTGITPAISASAAQICKDAVEAASRLGVKISGDINYRRNLWQYGKGPLDIMPELIAKTNLVIAGLTDFENCMDIHEKDYISACKKAQQKCPSIQYISTTYRDSVSASHNGLSGILWNGEQLLESKSYDMTHIVDRVGGGDAYMAGLIYGLLFLEDQQALEYAVAASVLKHSIPGDANFVSVEEVSQLVKGENVGKLLR
ncbi:2-dehydro-3-deoxygluconokinase [Echinicola pacifica]|uniref:2-dehydro-3-deoxygluconokinase n=1 Tax=Echinicola pacifica TaxID=346377 RepID=A0A918UKI1_9BACT|nr:sugar kinase [Echinicola pacifica]GGZ16445.1 2-dehydro-3-deoxygluconokinase [Echinicola pacifica]